MRSRFGSHLLEDDGQNPQNKYSKGWMNKEQMVSSESWMTDLISISPESCLSPRLWHKGRYYWDIVRLTFYIEKFTRYWGLPW
jgi:hypothetical protein